MNSLEIKGYKSIKSATIEFRPITILIGSNGSGKSNFLSFFEFLNRLYDQKLTEYVALAGGEDKMLFQGSKVTPILSAKIRFQMNTYSFELKKGESSFIFTSEKLGYDGNSWTLGDEVEITGFQSEAKIKSYDRMPRAKYIQQYLTSLKKYHFHDTGRNSPFNTFSHRENDVYFLYEKGENIAAFLYNIRENHQIAYQRILSVIRSVAPFFSDFYLQPNEEGFLRLQWQDKYSSGVYGASDLSDGTIRFIALATLFLQPQPPKTIIIDEPELGLHPFAIAKLAGMMQSAASKETQVIVATQSVELLNYFDAENIVAVDQQNGESILKQLKQEDLSEWLEEYSIGELWQRNIIQFAQPN